MVTSGGWSDSGRGEAGLGVGDGGGGDGESARVRNRDLVAGGGRSTKEGDDGASGRAPLVSGRREEERGGNDRRVLHPDKYLGVAWADRPPLPSRLSARLDVTMPPNPFQTMRRITSHLLRVLFLPR